MPYVILEEQMFIFIFGCTCFCFFILFVSNIIKSQVFSLHGMILQCGK